MVEDWLDSADWDPSQPPVGPYGGTEPSYTSEIAWVSNAHYR
jgi:hypothetical protein